MLKFLTGFCLVCLLFSFGATSLLAKGQPTTGISETKVFISDSSVIAERFPVTRPDQAILSTITSEEITLREQQIRILNDLESLFSKKILAGTGSTEDLLSLKYARLTNQIQLLQAKQLLRLKR
jgi:hypothetical protein